MRINLCLYVGVCLILVGLISACSQVDDKLLEPGISKKLAQLRKETISNLNYNLHFEIPKQKQSPISGIVEIQFDYTKSGKPLLLDFNSNPSDIESMLVNGVEAEVDLRHEHLLIGENLLSEKNTITIKFKAGEQSLNRKEEFLYTLFVPERASTCFPLFDQPDLKAVYSLSLTIPAEWEALANGQLAKETNKSDGSKTLKFSPTKRISSYLFAFAAGEFKRITQTVDGRQMSLLHRETDSVKVANNINEIFQWHVKSLNWLEEYTGQPQPFEHMSFVLIPSFQYGGMEHPGSIFYKASSLFLEESATLNQELGRARLIAHEVSHMWFGNLVTMEWFDDVWLKEVFANFMAAKIVNPEFEEINHDLKFLMSHYPGAYAVDRSMGTHPIKQELGNLKNAGSLYGSIIYQKAPIVMRMLEENVGVDNFRDAMREYLKTYAFDNASWDDLLQIIEKNTDYNVEYWNKKWVMSPGMPWVFYQLREDDEKIERFKLWTRVGNTEQEGIWPQQLTVLFGATDSTYQITADINYGFKELRGTPQLDYLFTNADGKGYGYFRMGPLSQKHFLENITKENPVVRASLWLNFYEMLLREEKSPSILMDHLLKELPNEKNDLVAEYMLDMIDEIFWRYLTPDKREKVAPKLEGLLLNMAISSANSQIQSSYFNTLRKIVITESGVQLLKSIWSEEMEVEGLDLSENDYIKLAQSLAIRVDNPGDILDNQHSRISNPDRKQRFEFVRQSLSKDFESRKQFFNSLKDPKNRENEEWVIEAMGFLNHPLRAESAVEFIKPGLKLLEEIKLTGDIFFPKRWLDSMLSGHNSYEADVIIRQFLFSNNSYPQDLKNKILQSADPVFRSVKVKEKYSKEDKEAEINQ